MIKITLGEIVLAQDALKKLLNHDLPITVSYKLSKLAGTVETEMGRYEAERIKLIKRLGQEDGNNISVKPENFEEFGREMSSLNAIEVEFPIEPISIQDLSEIRMTAVDIMKLSRFIHQ